jgi:hypothetical protein
MSNPDPPQVLQRIRAEYLEMPGLMLKPEQVQRLCGVDDSMCQLALETLVESGFLSVRPNGTYGRFSSPDISHARPATASLDSSASAVRRPHAS